MNEMEKNELTKIVKLTKLKFSENELEMLYKEIYNLTSIINNLNDLKINNENELVKYNYYSELREDFIDIKLNREELFENLNYNEEYNNGILIPKTFE